MLNVFPKRITTELVSFMGFYVIYVYPTTLDKNSMCAKKQDLILISFTHPSNLIKMLIEYLFFTSYYRQLYVDSKIKIYE